ncbi:MAG: hypothetical protein A3G41_01040 [Elusimicrobia bacterium RIFCSPLOWO2_12_FULL_59_9]|nr:MAG: hypothetical protein A3G41_01040 [Elusimicrobia bacterium RIFCSPLOWO2_12_FULL_59_9]
MIAGCGLALLLAAGAPNGAYAQPAESAANLPLRYQLELFRSTAQDFAAYVSNWSRLLAVSKAMEESKEAPSAVMLARKERYVTSRDEAKDLFSGDMEQARLVFGPEVRQAIEAFEEFNRKISTEVLEKLPPIAEWEAHGRKILAAMAQELGIAR